VAETVRRGGESSGGPLKGGRFALGMIIGVLASIFPYILISLLDVELAFGDRVQIFLLPPP
jgi:preprotein translocase subunit SecD